MSSSFIAQSNFESGAAIAFLVYTAGVFVLAALSHRLLQGRSFLSEYFLGSRSLGTWALAMTWAATSASGGSFTGFPALIYRHGWILLLWIASYMIVPVCVMGLLGKRLNQVARTGDAITVPDVFRERFGSPGLGMLSSVLLVFFLIFNLVAQFKAGAIIIDELIGDLPIYRSAAEGVRWLPETFSVLSDTEPGYCLALLLFAAAVITYTAYGGFRAVVWTDVLQGVVMFVGVLLLLGMTLSAVDGGLPAVTRKLAEIELVAVRVEATTAATLPSGSRVVLTRDADAPSSAAGDADDASPAGDANDAPLVHGQRSTLAAAEEAWLGFETHGGDVERWKRAQPSSLGLESREGQPLPVRILEVRHDPARNLVGVPGFSPGSSGGFLPFGLALSFFMMWAISGAGQPHYMVRLMAFRDTRGYRRAMFCVSIYFTCVYVPLVITFLCARVLLPELDEPDKAMARLVLTIAPGAIAGIIMAAPFAAIMSTVDSTLLVISSSLVRDLYQRTLRPDASPATIQRLSYLTTLVVGVIVMLGAFNPPRYLQNIIVLTGSGCACTYLAPMFFSLYWKRATTAGIVAGMFGGFGIFVGLHVVEWLSEEPALQPHPGGVLPLVWGLLASIVACVAVSYATRPPPAAVTRRFFPQR